MPDMIPAPAPAAPLWRLFIMPGPGLLVAAIALERILVLCRNPRVGVRRRPPGGRRKPRPAGSMIAAKRSVCGLSVSELEVQLRRPPSVTPGFRKTAGAGGAVHRAAWRNHGDRLDLSAETC